MFVWDMLKKTHTENNDDDEQLKSCVLCVCARSHPTNKMSAYDGLVRRNMKS